MNPHAYIAPMFPGRPTPRGCRHVEQRDGYWIRCERPEHDPIHENNDDKPHTVR